MTAGSWWFFTLIMVATYTANLAAFLAIETPDIPFKDVYGLVKVAPTLGIKYGAKSKGATETFFKVKILVKFSMFSRQASMLSFVIFVIPPLKQRI